MKFRSIKQSQAKRFIALLFLLCGLFLSVDAQPTSKKAKLVAAQKTFETAMTLFDEETVQSRRESADKFLAASRLFAEVGNRSKQAESLSWAGRAFDDLNEKKQALDYYGQALKMYRLLKNKENEALLLNNIGLIYWALNDNQQAEANYLAALKAASLAKDRSTEPLILLNLGLLYDKIGEQAKAVDSFLKSLEPARKFERGDIEVQALNALGIISLAKGEAKQAVDYFSRALPVAQKNGDRRIEAITLTNLAFAYDGIDEKQRALEYYRQTLLIFQSLEDKQTEATTLNNIGLLYESLGKKQDALKYFGQAFEAIRAVNDKNLEASILNNIGVAYDGLNEPLKAIEFYKRSLEMLGLHKNFHLAAKTLNNIVVIYLKLDEPQESLKLLDRMLPIVNKIGDRDLEAAMLNSLGRTYEVLGDRQKASDYYRQSLALARLIGKKMPEARALGNLMLLWRAAGNRQFAVFYGKQSVNALQELRYNFKSLDKDLKNSFLESVAGDYRILADILIELGRIAEAEQVLAMLKEEEVFDYLRRDKVAEDLLKQNVSFTASEREALARYDTLADQITAFGKEYSELDAERTTFDEGKFPKQARFDELKKQLAKATTAFQKFLDELKITFGQKDERVAAVDSGLQNTLKRLKANRTAIVSTIIGKDRLNIIVTTSATQRAHTVDVSDKDINQLVIDFRQALTNPEIDPRPTGQKLYDILVKPIEADLAGIEAETIVWSLDGTLRYIPTAALWDKQKGYLAERFASSVITLASFSTIESPQFDKQNLNVLGVGVSKAAEGFSALTAVPDELDCIITDTNTKTVSFAPKCQTGVLRGKKLLDEKFTLTAFEDALGRYPVVHIASHFSLNPGNDKDSFLLLGGGDRRRFTIENLRGVSFSDVELVALSACNTATPGGERANGVEIEGFAAVAQKQGAKAVMATLWSVADISTEEWMVKFYELYGKGNTGKSESLRRAQLAMMYGKYKSTDGNTIRGTAVFSLNGDKNQPPFKKDENAPYSHPFYWSPFILFGNWR